MLFSSTAQAEIVSVVQNGGNSSAGAAATIIGAPAFASNNVAFNFGMQGFDEAQDVVTTVAHLADGQLGLAAVIAVGSFVDSHMIFMNKNFSGALTHADVTWTFAGKILAIMSGNDGVNEANSSFELGAPGTDYTASGGGLGSAAPFTDRGLEDDPYDATIGFDTLSFSMLTPNSLTVSMRVTQPGDWIRVVTAAVPVPAAIWLFGTALIGFIGFSRRRIVA